jgi:hypothetical protein
MGGFFLALATVNGAMTELLAYSLMLGGSIWLAGFRLNMAFDAERVDVKKSSILTLLLSMPILWSTIDLMNMVRT